MVWHDVKNTYKIAKELEKYLDEVDYPSSDQLTTIRSFISSVSTQLESALPSVADDINELEIENIFQSGAIQNRLGILNSFVNASQDVYEQTLSLSDLAEFENFVSTDVMLGLSSTENRDDIVASVNTTITNLTTCYSDIFAFMGTGQTAPSVATLTNLCTNLLNIAPDNVLSLMNTVLPLSDIDAAVSTIADIVSSPSGSTSDVSLPSQEVILDLVIAQSVLNGLVTGSAWGVKAFPTSFGASLSLGTAISAGGGAGVAFGGQANMELNLSGTAGGGISVGLLNTSQALVGAIVELMRATSEGLGSAIQYFQVKNSYDA